MTQATLLCLPGHMCDASLWNKCLPTATELHVAKPIPPGSTIGEMAAWCLDHHDGPLLPLGFSMGGIVAIECLRQAPDRIRGLILIATNPEADRPDRAPVRLRQQDAVKSGQLERVVKNELIPAYFAEIHESRKDLAQHVIDMAISVGPDAFVSQSEALRLRNDLWDSVGDYSGPTLILCGSEDEVCPPILHQRIMDTAQNASLSIIPEAGHMLPIEQPASVREHIADWLSQNGIMKDGADAT